MTCGNLLSVVLATSPKSVVLATSPKSVELAKSPPPTSNNTCDTIVNGYIECRIKNNMEPTRCDWIYESYKMCHKVCHRDVVLCRNYINTSVDKLRSTK